MESWQPPFCFFLFGFAEWVWSCSSCSGSSSRRSCWQEPDSRDPQQLSGELRCSYSLCASSAPCASLELGFAACVRCDTLPKEVPSFRLDLALIINAYQQLPLCPCCVLQGTSSTDPAAEQDDDVGMGDEEESSPGRKMLEAMKTMRPGVGVGLKRDRESGGEHINVEAEAAGREGARVQQPATKLQRVVSNAVDAVREHERAGGGKVHCCMLRFEGGAINLFLFFVCLHILKRTSTCSCLATLPPLKVTVYMPAFQTADVSPPLNQGDEKPADVEGMNGVGATTVVQGAATAEADLKESQPCSLKGMSKNGSDSGVVPRDSGSALVQ